MASTIIGSVGIRVLPETKTFVPALSKYLQRVERQVQLQVPLGLDSSTVDDQLRAVRARANRTELSPPVEPDTTAATAQLRAWIARQSAQSINIDVDVSRGLSGMTRMGASALSAGGSLLQFGAAATALTSGLAHLTTGLLGAGGALVSMSGTLGLLPALGAAGAAAIGTLVVGMQGFGTALSEMDDTAKFNEALKDLAPAAQTAARSIRGLREPFGALRLDVQQQLFAGLGKTITDIGTAYLPVLQRGMTGLAASLNQSVKQFGAFATAKQTLHDTQTVFTNTSAAMQPFTAGLVNIVTALRDVGTVGSTFLPGLATSFQNATKRLQEFVASARQTGQLNTWIQSGIDAFGQLWQIIKNVGGILSGLYDAAGASGAGFLTTLENITGAMNTFLASSEGAKAVGQIFEGLRAPISAVVAAITSMGSGLGATLVKIGPVVQQVGTMIGSVLGNALRIVLPILGQVATLLGQTLLQGLQAIQPFLPTLLSSFQGLLQALMPVVPLLGQLAQQFLPPLAMLFSQLMNALGPIVTLLIQTAQAALPPLIGAFMQVMQALTPLVPLIGQLAQALLPPLVRLFTAAVQAVAPLIPPIVSLAQTALPPLAQALGIVIRALRPLLPPIAQLIGALLPPLQALFQAIAPILPQLARMFAQVVQALTPLLPPIAQLISSLLPPMIRLATAAAGPLVSLASAFLRTVLPAIQAVIGVIGSFIGWIGRMIGKAASAVASVVQFFANLGSRVIGALGDAGSWLVNVGKNIVQGLINGIKSLIGNIGSTLVNGVKGAVDGVMGMLGISSPSTVFAEIGRHTVEGMVVGLERTTPDAVRSAEQMARRVAGVSPTIDATVGATGGRPLAEEMREALAGMGIEVNAGQLTRWVDRQHVVNAGR